MHATAIHAQATHDRADQGIDHDDQLARMLAAYDRPITTYLDRAELDYTTLEYVRGLVRQAIEQAWDAGHACAKQNNDA